jgi:hypothetical protein
MQGGSPSDGGQGGWVVFGDVGSVGQRKVHGGSRRSEVR